MSGEIIKKWYKIKILQALSNQIVAGFLSLN
jgi:hypothetical protein